MGTIFYAWQSDLPSKCNHYFIREAAEEAVVQLKSELKVEDAPDLDHDTKGVPGTPEIAHTIFSKINNCSIFLADVSLVGKSTPDNPQAIAKSIPNPNVMIELGYALNEVSSERIVLVMNTAFGGPSELPFDLRSRRHPIAYSLKTWEDPSRNAIQKRLIESLKIAFRAIVQHAPTTTGTGLSTEALATAALSRMTQINEEFCNRALRNELHEFAPERGVVLVTLIPDKPISPVLNFSEERFKAISLQPIYADPSRPEIFGRSIVASARYPSSSRVFSVTELNEHGVIVAADGDLLNHSADSTYSSHFKQDHIGYVASIAYEQSIIHMISENLKLLRMLGVSMPIRASISLYRVQNYVMGVSQRELMLGQAGRIYTGPGITPDPVLFKPQMTELDFVNVAKHLRPTFDLIWREFGFSRSRNFDSSGEWRQPQRSG